MRPYESRVDRQIREAQERGDFDNLPGAGKPLPGLDGRRDDENWWVRGLLEREQMTMPLPTSLLLRKQVTELQETLADVRGESEVREIVLDLNARIVDSHRRRVDGPPIVTRPVDVEEAVREWRERQGGGQDRRDLDHRALSAPAGLLEGPREHSQRGSGVWRRLSDWWQARRRRAEGL